MPNITKQKGSDRYVSEIGVYDGTSVTSYSYTPWSDTIVYEAGPRKVDGHCNWKSCRHEWAKHPNLAYASARSSDGSSFRSLQSTFGIGMVGSCKARPTDLPPMQMLWDKFYDQINLNTSDGVLLYSGILQSIPLLGGALKGVSVLNRAARRLKKGMLNAPFTTVVKTMISYDFIERFVVKPTIDDMQKFADSFDYVLRVINTARSRNAELATAFETEATNVVSRSIQESGPYSYGFCRVRSSSVEEHVATRKLKILAKVTYDQDVISPFKLWAARAGLSRPLDSVWDLVPFSFVIDYFFRAGDFLSSVSDKFSDQDALKGRVSVLHDAWLMEKLQVTHKSKLQLSPYSSYWVDFRSSDPEIESSRGVFTRAPVDIMSESGFWDRGGFVSPSLSNTRIRTLFELALQAKL